MIRKSGIIIIGICTALLYWWLDTTPLIPSPSTDRQGFSSHVLWLRLLVVLGILAFSAFTQYMINRCRRQQFAVRAAYAEIQQVLDTAVDGMRVIDKDFRMLLCNKTFVEMAGLPEHEVIGRKCFEVFSGPNCHTPGCPLVRILGGEKSLDFQCMKRNKAGREIPCHLSSMPFMGPGGELLGIVESFRDISERQEWDQEREELISDLIDALREVKTLTGLLPICSWCKKIRDDSGYWQQLEEYFAAHSSTRFTHSICPECRQREFPQCDDKEPS